MLKVRMETQVYVVWETSSENTLVAKCQVFVITVGFVEVCQLSVKEQFFSQAWKWVKIEIDLDETASY